MHRTLNSDKFMTLKAGDKPVEHTPPYTQEEKEIITNLIGAEINLALQQGKEDGTILTAENISDGYHTFKELYDMRLALTVALFYSRYLLMREGLTSRGIWRSKLHKDGTMFENYFIVGMTANPFGNKEGVTANYLSFHYHIDHWDKFHFCDTLDKAPEWDGHTEKDVIERLLGL